MKRTKPCVGRRGDWYGEDEYVRHNQPIVRRDGEAAVRADHRRMLAGGMIPPMCPVCGWHHKSEERASDE